METETTAEPTPVRALREYAQAIRGDWGDLDGRSVRIQLNQIADAIQGGTGSDWTMERWRDDMGVCPNGQGHWTVHCNVDYCGSEPTRW